MLALHRSALLESTWKASSRWVHQRWLAPSRRWFHPGSLHHRTGALLAGMLALLVLTTAGVVLQARTQIWRESSESALTIALGLQSASSGALSQPIVSLLRVEKDLAGGERSESDARNALVSAMHYDSTSVYMGVSVPGGALVVVARDGPASREIVDALRTRLRAQQAGGLGVQKFINVPGSRDWFLPVTLTAGDATGAFAFSLVPARQLVAGTDSLRLLPESYVSFVATDGQRLLRYWKDSDAIEVNGPMLPEERLDAMKEHAQGTFEFFNSITGRAQIAGYVHSSQLPLYVAAVVPTSSLYLRWATFSAGPVLVLVMGAAAVATYALRLRRALAAEAEVREQALTDKLTALPNRRALDADIRQVLALSSRCGKSFAIVMIDIDFFKAINDAFGHQAGDDVLRAFAQRLRSALRAQDRAYRYGGEEFCVMVPATDAPGVQVLAERLRRAVALAATPKMHAVTASFGVALWELGDDADLLFGRADEALYRAKAAGRNRVEVAG